MFGFRYLKSEPTSHVFLYKNGRITRQGAGLSVFYFAPTATVVRVPLASRDVPFVFEETTRDFQDVTIQGELTFRIADPDKISQLLDFTIGPNGRFTSDDPTKLNDRLIQATKTIARGFVQQRELGEVLIGAEPLVQHTLAQLRQSETAGMLGVEVIGINLHSIKPTPEMAKALQANAREKLLQQADEALYARRNTAVQLERELKENELNSQVAIEEKNREVERTKLEALIAHEQQRTDFVEQKVENDRKESRAHTESVRDFVNAVKDVDWRTLLATGAGGLDSGQMIAMAFRDLADSADKIGNLNVSPELLSQLLQTSEPTAKPAAPTRASQKQKKS